MKIAIMQPYIFPYIGYFQLVHAADVFVFFDDVNFIKRGWINRNRILVNGKENLFTIALSKVSQNKLINEIEVVKSSKSIGLFLKTLEWNYKNAPYFDSVYNLVEKVMNGSYKTISDLAILSVKSISEYLGISTVFEISSEMYPETRGMEKSERLIEISNIRGCSDYINPIGGKEIYSKQNFKRRDVNLWFIENVLNPYKQFEDKPVLGLSIIDVLMFNSKEDALKLIREYKLI